MEASGGMSPQMEISSQEPPPIDVGRGRSRTRTTRQRSLRTPSLHRGLARESRSRSRRRSVRSRRSRDDTRFYDDGRRASRRCSRSRGPSRYRSRSREPARANTTSSREARQLGQKSEGAAHDIMAQFTQLLDSLKSAGNSSREHFSNMNVVPEFDPSLKNQSISNWLTKVNECAVLYGWTERQVVHYALPKLVGVAKKWYEGLPTLLFSWHEWQTKLKSAFPSEENYGQMLWDMLTLRAKFGESLEDYYYEKVALLNRCDIVGKRAVECLLHGIDDRSVRLGAEAAQFDNTDKLLAYLRNVKTGVFKNSNVTSKRYRESKSNAPPTTNTLNKSTPNIRCYNCKQDGHPLSKCPKPIKKCTKCSLIGHVDSECFRFKSEGKREENKGKSVLLINESLENKPPNKYVQDVLVNNWKTTCFVDLGSDLTLIRECEAKKMFDKFNTNVSHPMIGFGGAVVNSLGSCMAHIQIQGVKAQVTCVVVPDKLLKYPLLVGQTFTEQPHVRILKTESDLLFTTNYDVEGLTKRLLQLRVVSDVSVKGVDLLEVDCGSKFDGDVYIPSRCRNQPGKEYQIEEGIYSIKNGFGQILITPLNLTPITFKKNELIARVEIVLESFGFCEINRVESLKSLEPFTLQQLNIGDLSDDHKLKLLNLVNSYRDCFATSLNELGCTSIEKMNIDLNDEQPVVYRPYRLSQKEREDVQGMIDELSATGIIRESSSPYASPIILVKKKTGDKRLCVDYRALNRKTIKQHYPLPCMEDQMNRLSGNSYFCTLDLASGYYQIELAEQAKPKTAFVTPDGQWEFNRMPFGLANAPAVFQRTVNKALGTLRFNTAVAYMDDVLVPSATVEEGLERLELIFKRLREFNLTLKPSKCFFFQTCVEFLGFEVTEKGIKPGNKKIEAVKSFPVPKNVHNVRQFLGLASFFRKFIKNFAVIARPLTCLLKNNVLWEWGSDQEQAFQELKERLVSRPILALYNPSLKTQLHTDASKWGVGGILLQEQESGDLKPIAYFSRQTSPIEQHFSSYELETLAVVSSLAKFRSYLLGMPFVIVTDCNSLRATFMKRDMIPRVARWWSLIQEFDCDIKYKSGQGMCHVDALSRNPIASDGLGELDLPQVLNISKEWIKTVQSADSEVERIKHILQDPDNRKVVDVKQNFCIKNDCVYKITDNGPKWLVPKGVRWHILKACHDDIGHFSVEKTIDKIKETYWFPKLTKFTKKYVQSCLECAHSKVPSGKKSGYLHPIPKISKPFHTLHADHLGPFNTSRRKNKYLLVIIDSYSKFIILKAVKNTKAYTTIMAFKEYFATFGCPVRLITDRYSSFTGKKFKCFLENVGVKHVMNAVATPRANGQVERYNRTILDSLTAMNYGLDEVDWDSKVLDVQWGLNNTTNKGIGRTPAEVLFGLSLTSMAEGKLRSTLDNDTEQIDLTKNLEVVRKEVDEHITKTQQEQKDRFDKVRCDPRKFNIGDLVRVERSILCPGKSKKLISKCLGPYKIIEVLSNDRYTVEDTAITKRKGKTTYRGVHPVERIHPWLNFKRSEGDESSDDRENCESSNDEDTG